MHSDLVASQLAALSHSAARLARARAYTASLDSHAARLRACLDAAAGGDTAGPPRAELVEVDRQHRQATEILRDIEAEHARHEADLAALHGADGQARAKLAETHQVRDAAKVAAADAKAILDRAEGHTRAVDGKLAAARDDEARHDAEATARLAVALRDSTEAPSAAEPFARTSPGLEDDLRAARAVVGRLAAEHEAKLAALAEAERQVRGAADAVLLAEADAMAREIAALDARADLLRGRLTAYTGRAPGDYVPPASAVPDPTRNPWSPPPTALPTMHRPMVASSPAIAAALVDKTYVRERPRDASGETRAWNAFAAELTADAEAAADFATVSPGPAPLPSVTLVRFPASTESVPAAAA